MFVLRCYDLHSAGGLLIYTEGATYRRLLEFYLLHSSGRPLDRGGLVGCALFPTIKEPKLLRGWISEQNFLRTISAMVISDLIASRSPTSYLYRTRIPEPDRPRCQHPAPVPQLGRDDNTGGTPLVGHLECFEG